jgi:hypothetical protein
MQVLQKAATMLTVKKGTQQTRKTPMMTPTVMAALWSETWHGDATAAPFTFMGRVTALMLFTWRCAYKYSRQ